MLVPDTKVEMFEALGLFPTTKYRIVYVSGHLYDAAETRPAGTHHKRVTRNTMIRCGSFNVV